MSEEVVNINEAESNIINEEAPKEAPKEVIEHEVSCSIREPVKEEAIKEAPPKEDEHFKNKTERLKQKKVKCEGCNTEMTLKSLRYSHKCKGKTEATPVKPKPKATKIIAKPIVNEVVEEEPIYFKETKEKVKQQQIHTPQQPPANPMTSILDNYKLIHQEYLNKKREKTNALCANMFSGSLRSKRR